MTTPTPPPTAEQIQAAHDQLAAFLALDDQADEKLSPSRRNYITNILAVLEWVVEQR